MGNVTAQAKLDQAGQEALDAIYAEQVFENTPEVKRLTKLAALPGDEGLAQAKELFGSADFVKTSLKYISWALELKSRREKAVTSYYKLRDFAEKLTESEGSHV